VLTRHSFAEFDGGEIIAVY